MSPAEHRAQVMAEWEPTERLLLEQEVRRVAALPVEKRVEFYNLVNEARGEEAAKQLIAAVNKERRAQRSLF